MGTRIFSLPFDPWLRVHVRKNAKIINVCKKAVEIKGTVNQWETWTNMKFPESGKYVVEIVCRESVKFGVIFEHIINFTGLRIINLSVVRDIWVFENDICLCQPLIF